MNTVKTEAILDVIEQNYLKWFGDLRKISNKRQRKTHGKLNKVKDVKKIVIDLEKRGVTN